MPRTKKEDDGLPFADGELPRGQAMREFVEWATGEAPPPGQVVPVGDIKISDGLIQRMVLHSLATLHSLADRGHFRAAQFIVQLGLGSTEKPFSEQVQNLEREEARQQLFELYRRKGLTEENAWKMVNSAGKLQALPEKKEK